ncbi:hypothetical protein MRB53_019041 [Persea americana]|uniref:Uncharacterized protein n=1 Tax=Persea americana TaxID=3435 RepID=A0ACC2MB13_PERAE|nr:hypothetical protein MRB53_019041 [Persea americana]
MATVLGLYCTDIVSKIKPWDLRLILLVIGSEHNVMTSSNVHRCGNHAFNQSQSQGAFNLNVLQFKLNFALHPSDSDLTYLFTCGKSEKDRETLKKFTSSASRISSPSPNRKGESTGGWQWLLQHLRNWLLALLTVKGKRVHFVKTVIREVFPAKRKLGTHKRAKKKREEMSNVLRKMRSAGVSEKKKQ